MKIFEVLQEQESNKRDELHTPSQQNREELNDVVYWYILDHDTLHKKHGVPIAYKMANLKKQDKLERDKFVDCWMPMVKEGCMAYYKENRLEDDPKDLFTIEMRKDLCHRLADQYFNDVLNDEYSS